ncbi:MAG: hypothetical protein FJ403_02650 [Verrucomicrobia bacterium]|nr:hypothetical protein [Verrucomicrobiota bacterium]
MKIAFPLAWAAVVGASSLLSHAATNDYFTISVIDEQTGRGVPLVELKTVNHAAWWTDSNGIIAFYEPGLMDQEVFFHVRSHGCEYPKDFFNFRGVKLKPRPGSSATIKIKRLNIAERLYRITGQGIYRDSILAGHPVPTRQPLLNGLVTGQDTVIVTPYRGKLYWFWGDTDRVGYALGNFGASGATSELPGRGGLDPSVGVNLTYFVAPNGFSKPMCPLPGQGLRWIEGLMTLPDETGRERLVARLANHRDLGYTHDWHLMVFNDEKEVFESIRRWEIHDGHDSAHPFRADVGGVQYYYLYPNWRVRADLKSLADLQNYEALTCVAGDGKVRGKDTEVDRDGAARPRYSWKAGADRLHSGRRRQLTSAGRLKPEENWIQLHDIETGSPVEAARGSVYWNEFRKRWVMIMSAKAGEIWFAEGDTPAGPWVYARRVVSHDNYNFYNPTQHPFFDQENGRLIYFEGTYTASFSGAREKTPRYDYNQIMYRLALDDSRLSLPAPVYRMADRDGNVRYLFREEIEKENAWKSIKEVAFFAVPPARERPGLAPIFAMIKEGKLSFEAMPSNALFVNTDPAFFALPAATNTNEESVSGLWQCAARTTDGAELKFDLQLAQRGTAVEVAGTSLTSSRAGSFEGDRLTLELMREGRSYLLTGQLQQGKLTGEWKQSDSDLKGAWSAERINRLENGGDSPAVAGLYEYQREGGGRLYSTNPDLKDPPSKRSPEPLCRVWRNPSTVLVLDFEAKPQRGEN